MRRSLTIATVAGALALGLGTLSACEASHEEEKTCAARDEEIGDGPVFGSLTVCDADTANLNPLTDELLTEDEFRKRQETFTEDARDVFEGGFDPNAGEYDVEEGMLPCDSWAGKYGRDV
jgi:hypothetical protein